MNPVTYFIELVLRDSGGAPEFHYITSEAANIDDAYAHRCRIAKEYHKNQIISVTVRQFKRKS